jgi:putative endonuclease
LDIVARDGPTIVFVEVKTRDGGEFGSGVESVTALKQRR